MTEQNKRGLIARKVGMARVAVETGEMIPVTLLKIEDQKVTKVLDTDRDGYTGYQLGYRLKSEKNLNKADLARLKKAGVEENYSLFKEFRVSAKANTEFKLGDALSAEMFKDVSFVEVTGLSKGRGFQGAVKRWGASIGRMTHGSRFHRRPGSLGQCSTPGRVFKNKHQPGHMGVDVKTVKNLKVVDVDLENNLIALKGSVPGNKGSYLQVIAAR